MNHDQKANGDIRERVMYCSVLFFLHFIDLLLYYHNVAKLVMFVQWVGICVLIMQIIYCCCIIIH